MSKIQLSDIQTEVKKNGWQLISTEYINLKTEMQFRCQEGHDVFLSWNKVRDKFVCPICKRNRFSDKANEFPEKKKGTQRVLALDQATYKTGYSVFDNQKLIKYGVFETKLSDEIARDSAIKTWLISMIDGLNPDYVAIEGIQYEQHFGVVVFQTLARLQGILLETLYWEKIPYLVCPTNTWRAYCQVKGRARADKKRSMQQIIKQNYDVSVTDDEADAIGIGKYAAETLIKKTIITNWE